MPRWYATCDCDCDCDCLGVCVDSVWLCVQVTLRALRLRLVLAAGEFDVLPLCQLRLSSGLLPVAAALDASRLLPVLACGPDLHEEAGLRRVRAVSGDLLRRQASKGTWKVGSLCHAMCCKYVCMRSYLKWPCANDLLCGAVLCIGRPR